MADKRKMNIIIADDCPEFIEGLTLLLSVNGNFRIIDTCKNGLELVNSKNLPHADLLLVDIDMPGMNGLDAAKTINYNYNKLPMIAMSMYTDRVYLQDIIYSGFKAFVNKLEVVKELFNVIELTLNNKYVFPKNLHIEEGMNRNFWIEHEGYAAV